MPADAPEGPPAAPRLSSNSTRPPRSASWYAALVPITPAPITAISVLSEGRAVTARLSQSAQGARALERVRALGRKLARALDAIAADRMHEAQARGVQELAPQADLPSRH